MNAIHNNSIFGNNFLRHNILGVFGLQIKILKIFYIFPKIYLAAAAMGGWQRQWMAKSSDSFSG